MQYKCVYTSCYYLILIVVPAVPKERRRLTANQVKLHIQEIAIQLRKALIPKEMARKALIQEVLVREVHLQEIQEAIHRR